MSLVSTFVIMASGKWYKNPCIFDKTNDWYICFDDDDPPELVIYQPGQLSKVKRMERIFEIVDGANIKARLQVQTVTLSNRLFPPNWSGTFKPAVSIYLEIYEPIVLDELEVKHDGVSDELPTNLCGYVAYDFKKVDTKKDSPKLIGKVPKNFGTSY